MLEPFPLLRRFAQGALALSLLLGLGTAAPARADDTKEAEELLRFSDDMYRGQSSVAIVTMHVKTKRWERNLKLKMWAKGTERSLIRILEPKKERGVTTLKVEKDMWNYLPKVDRVIKVPASMMGGSWMGSHFTNDDLVRESRYSEDFTLKIVERPKGGKGKWVIELMPKPDTPVVWGKVTAEIGPDKIPLKNEFYDERGNLVRTMVYSDVREVSGRRIPMRMKLIPTDKPQEYTEIVQDKIAFDVDIDDRTFTLQALKR